MRHRAATSTLLGLLGILVTVRSAVSQESVGRSVQGYAFFAPGFRPESPQEGIARDPQSARVAWPWVNPAVLSRRPARAAGL